MPRSASFEEAHRPQLMHYTLGGRIHEMSASERGEGWLASGATLVRRQP